MTSLIGADHPVIALAFVAEPSPGSGDGPVLLVSLLSAGVTMLLIYLVCTWTDTTERTSAAIRAVRHLPSRGAIAATTCRLCGRREATKGGWPCEDCLHSFRSELDRWGHEQDTA